MSDAIMVLGAAGFIGRHLCDAIATTGTRVIAATRQPATFDDAAIGNVVGTFDRAEQFMPLLAQCRGVVHAASSSTPGSSAAQPQLDGNLRTTLALIEALQHYSDRRLLYLSSGGTLYGDRDRAAREDDALRPRSYHGAGKAAAEHFVHAWAMQYGGMAVVLRPSNVYGPGQVSKDGFGIIPTAFRCALDNVPLTIWGDGSSVRDFLYVQDLMPLSLAALDAKLGPGMHVFNASCDHGVTLNHLLDAIDAITGRALQRDYQPARRVDVTRIVPDNGAARVQFGWHPRTSLEQGLVRTWQWFSTRA